MLDGMPIFIPTLRSEVAEKLYTEVFVHACAYILLASVYTMFQFGDWIVCNILFHGRL